MFFARLNKLSCACIALFLLWGCESNDAPHVSAGSTVGELPAPPSSGAEPPTTNPDPADPVPTPAEPNEVPLLGSVVCQGRTHERIVDTNPGAWSSLAQRRAAAAIECDTVDIGARIAALQLSSAKSVALQEQLRYRAREAIRLLGLGEPDTSRLPLSFAHQEMYAVAAEAERTQGFDLLSVAPATAWEPLYPLQRLQNAEMSELSVALMRGERRAIALNLRSVAADSQDVDLALNVSGLPASAFDVYLVNWTGTDESNWAAAELQLLGDASRVHSIRVLPGVTQQIWIYVEPDRSVDPTVHRGEIEIVGSASAAIRLPLAITVFTSTFPPRPTLHVGGWDYTDDPRPGYVVSEANRAQIIEHLSARFVDLPWAHSGGVMHWRFLDSDGMVSGSVDRSLMERWLTAWPTARRFRVYVNATDNIAGIGMRDPRFSSAVANWLQTWAAEIRSLNRAPEEFDLLLVDEPRNAAHVETTTIWADAVRRSGTPFRIWVDPWYSNPAEIPATLVEAVDTIAVNIPMAQAAGDAYWHWASDVATQGKIVEVYGTSGPARRLDPYAGYLLPAWRAALMGATAISFWSFADTGGVGIGDSFSDDEFASPGYNYSPVFINRSEVRAGKHMEAIVHGVQDAEYIFQLKHVAASHPDGNVRARAEELLAQVTQLVADTSVNSSSTWRSQRESISADRLRTSIGSFLDSARAP